MGQTLVVGPKSGIIDQLGAADRVENLFSHALHRSRKRDIVAISASIDIPGAACVD